MIYKLTIIGQGPSGDSVLVIYDSEVSPGPNARPNVAAAAKAVAQRFGLINWELRDAQIKLQENWRMRSELL